MTNMYTGQLKKIDQTLAKLHSDIQAEFQSDLRELEL